MRKQRIKEGDLFEQIRSTNAVDASSVREGRKHFQASRHNLFLEAVADLRGQGVDERTISAQMEDRIKVSESRIAGSSMAWLLEDDDSFEALLKAEPSQDGDLWWKFRRAWPKSAKVVETGSSAQEVCINQDPPERTKG